MPIKNRLGWTTFFGGILCGLIIGAFFTLFLLSWQKAAWQLNWKNEIGFGDLFNFLSNIFIAVVIAFLLTQYIQKFIADKRSEKNILMTIIEGAESSLESLHQLFITCCDENKITAANHRQILTKQRELSNRLSLSQSCLDKCKYHFDVVEIQKEQTEYKKILTGDSFDKKKYKPNDKASAERHYLRMKEQLQNLTIDINKA